MNKYQEALNSIISSYDAFFMCNRYGLENTHKDEFEILSHLKGEYVENAIAWIKQNYDCYYATEYLEQDDNAIIYLQKIINGLEKGDEDEE